MTGTTALTAPLVQRLAGAVLAVAVLVGCAVLLAETCGWTGRRE